ncbi:DUF4406 domain-containing protein [Nitrobacteraceae bacterium UC4449_H16]
MKIYLAGPMAGYPDHNFPAFNAKAADLRSRGHEVYNPAEVEPEQYRVRDADNAAEFHNGRYRNCLSQELRWICDHAEGMYLLNGWEHSKGANAEFAAGKAVGLFFEYQQPQEA